VCLAITRPKCNNKNSSFDYACIQGRKQEMNNNTSASFGTFYNMLSSAGDAISLHDGIVLIVENNPLLDISKAKVCQIRPTFNISSTIDLLPALFNFLLWA
jgi:hypothetical protein